MEWERRLEFLSGLIRRLEKKVGQEDFLIRYFDGILALLKKAHGDSGKVAEAMEAVLRYELWHHGTLRRLAQTPDLQGRYLIPLGVEMRTALLSLTQRLKNVSVFGSPEKAVLSLLLAHCHYQLGNTQAVISALEEAVANGASDPIVFFALGFNRHKLALTHYARWEALSKRLVVLDREGFETQMRRAIDDFKKGLSVTGTEPGDAQLYMWIGLIYELLGEREEAAAAYEKARELNPSAFAEEVEGHLQLLRTSHERSEKPPPPALPRPLVPESEVASSFPAITDAELERLRKTISEVSTLTDFLKRIESGGSGPGN